MNLSNVNPRGTEMGLQCYICGAAVFEPVYWNVERQELFCGAMCALHRHEEFRSFEKTEQQKLYAKLT